MFRKVGDIINVKIFNEETCEYEVFLSKVILLEEVGNYLIRLTKEEFKEKNIGWSGNYLVESEIEIIKETYKDYNNESFLWVSNTDVLEIGSDQEFDIKIQKILNNIKKEIWKG